ncbi:hypothetical protein KC19_7G137400 [Ceratodon purpureus]|uniref:Uncharacterized protein n=1 Tax=Ceratodon purpureus TaxID=3225 RepID=A0A8T0H7V0_CERPU|nr:hypothetical protein KC19_7G137400 [Ceratodon purpureus]
MWWFGTTTLFALLCTHRISAPKHQQHSIIYSIHTFSMTYFHSRYLESST